MQTHDEASEISDESRWDGNVYKSNDNFVELYGDVATAQADIVTAEADIVTAQADIVAAEAAIVVLESLPLRDAPASVTVTAGGTPVGTVANVQTMLDGDVYQVPEVSATPGFDVRFNFTGLTELPDTIVTRAWYDGSATHGVRIELYDYVGVAFVPIHQVPTSLTYAVATVSVVPEARFVSSGEAIVRFAHYTGGNASHDMFWDYVGLWRSGAY